MNPMRRACSAIAVAVTLGGATLAAQGGLVTGHALRESCQQYIDGEFVRTACERLVQEVVDTSRVIGEMGICLPPRTPREPRQQVLTVVAYLDEHPDELGDEDVTLVVRALQAAFPCR
jgi:hypothetical protein